MSISAPRLIPSQFQTWRRPTFCQFNAEALKLDSEKGQKCAHCHVLLLNNQDGGMLMKELVHWKTRPELLVSNQQIFAVCFADRRAPNMNLHKFKCQFEIRIMTDNSNDLHQSIPRLRSSASPRAPRWGGRRCYRSFGRFNL